MRSWRHLTAAAAVTERVGLFSNVTIGPVYDRALLAKLAAGLDQISEGRFVLGLATGWRDEDYIVADKEHKGRGDRLDADLEYMLRAWRGELVEGATKRLTPTPTNADQRRGRPAGLRRNRPTVLHARGQVRHRLDGRWRSTR